MIKWAKRFLKWSVWQESRLMSRVHIIIDRAALWIKEENFSIWKKWLIKTLKLYYSLNGHDRPGDHHNDDESDQD